jgi:hypothetical protein
LQVIFRGTYWIRSWALLSKEKEKDELKGGCQRLEIVCMDFFAKSEVPILITESTVEAYKGGMAPFNTPSKFSVLKAVFL